MGAVQGQLTEIAVASSSYMRRGGILLLLWRWDLCWQKRCSNLMKSWRLSSHREIATSHSVQNAVVKRSVVLMNSICTDVDRNCSCGI